MPPVGSQDIHRSRCLLSTSALHEVISPQADIFRSHGTSKPLHADHVVLLGPNKIEAADDGAVVTYPIYQTM
jgi:hypothetical protein